MKHAAATELPPPRGAYGSPRLTAKLRERGEVVSHTTVAKVMASIAGGGHQPAHRQGENHGGRPGRVVPPVLVDRCFDQDRLDAASPKLSTAQIRDLAALRWLAGNDSVVLHGPAGVEKPM